MNHDDSSGQDTAKNRLELTAFLAAISLFCSSLELLIPKPLPFFRLGLANLPLLIGLPLLGWKDYLWLMLLKTLGQGLVNGTLFSFQIALSAASTLASGPLMRLLWMIRGQKKPWISPIGISICGAISSNIAQLAVAQMLFFGPSIWLVAPPLFALGLATSLLVGLAASAFMRSSIWYARVHSEGLLPSRYSRELSTDRKWKPNRSIIPVIMGLAMLPPLFLQQNAGVQTLSMAACLLLALSSGRKFRPMPPLLLVFSMLFLSLLQPSGEILFHWGIIQITRDALIQGWSKAMLLVSLIYVSLYMTSGRPSLPGTAGKLISTQLSYFGQLSGGWTSRGKDSSKTNSSHRKKTYMSLLKTIDTILCEASWESEESPAAASGITAHAGKTSGFPIAAVLTILVLYTLPVIFRGI